MLLFRQRRPSEIQEFVKNNSPSDSDGTAGDSWKKYLVRNGGQGSTFYDLEQSYLAANGYSRWDLYLATFGFILGVMRERVRGWLASILAPPSSRLLKEDNGLFILEDGSGNILLD